MNCPNFQVVHAMGRKNVNWCNNVGGNYFLNNFYFLCRFDDVSILILYSNPFSLHMILYTSILCLLVWITHFLNYLALELINVYLSNVTLVHLNHSKTHGDAWEHAFPKHIILQDFFYFIFTMSPSHLLPFTFTFEIILLIIFYIK